MGNSYLDLPFLIGRPLVCDALDDARLVADLVLVDELLSGQVIDVDAIDVVNEIIWNLADFVLLVEVLVLGPLLQE